VSARNTHERSRSWRIAAIVYGVIVVLGLSGTGAHAWWSLNGAVASAVVAGAWAPQGVNPASVTCTRKDGPLLGDSYTDLTLNWGPVDATAYTVRAVKGSVAKTTTTSSATATLRLEGAAALGTQRYSVTITPSASGLDGTPARINAELSKVLLVSSVKCTPAAQPAT
jgi:hypothetical protein